MVDLLDHRYDQAADSVTIIADFSVTSALRAMLPLYDSSLNAQGTAMDRAFFAKLSTVSRAAVAAAVRGGVETENKGGAQSFDPVTEADRAAERALRAVIAHAFPDHGVWGEEYGWTGQGAATHWSLDPIDGTRAFICGLPNWAVLVGLLHDGEHLAGMIDLPALDETLVGIDGVTFRNGQQVHASDCTSLAEARFSTTDPFLFRAEEAEQIGRIRKASRVARYGLDAMAYARVATGDIDLVIESGLQAHDYDALVAVVRGAGGHIGAWDGSDDLRSGKVVAAATRSLYEEAVALIS
jgi:myo-inositol-1(or 4)-monophosphatase